MILDKTVKTQGVSEWEHDFIIGTPMNHYCGIKLMAISCRYNNIM